MSKLELVNGLPRMQAEFVAPTIYDQSIDIVTSDATPPNEINGPLSAGSDITLPSSQTYDSEELEVWLNADRLEETLDYNFVGNVPRTKIQMTFDLEVGDRLRLRIDRPA